MTKKAVLLVNLGTPEKADKKSVKRFLNEFLSDIRVVDRPRWFWFPLLHLVILPFRVNKVTKLYQSIWSENGSPLRFYTQQQTKKLAAILPDQHIEYAMTYGQPSIASQVKKLQKQGITKLTVLPLYPQYSVSTTAPIFDQLALQIKQQFDFPAINFIHDYHDHPLYITALANSIKKQWEKTGQSELLIFSFHGIPKRYVTLGDAYQAQAIRTVELLVQELGLNETQYQLCYQSRMGREEWLTPYLDKSLAEYAQSGIKSVDLVSPAFAADCLETLEELSVENRATFINNGGEAYHYIPCLNAQGDHIKLLKAIVS